MQHVLILTSLTSLIYSREYRMPLFSGIEFFFHLVSCSIAGFTKDFSSFTITFYAFISL